MMGKEIRFMDAEGTSIHLNYCKMWAAMTYTVVHKCSECGHEKSKIDRTELDVRVLDAWRGMVTVNVPSEPRPAKLYIVAETSCGTEIIREENL